MNVKILEQNLEEASRLLKALSNEKRLAIICNLFDGEKSVGALEQIVNLSQSALSQHLARLRNDGLVSTRREAQTIYYTLDHETVEALLGCLSEAYDDSEDDKPCEDD